MPSTLPSSSPARFSAWSRPCKAVLLSSAATALVLGLIVGEAKAQVPPDDFADNYGDTDLSAVGTATVREVPLGATMNAIFSGNGTVIYTGGDPGEAPTQSPDTNTLFVNGASTYTGSTEFRGISRIVANDALSFGTSSLLFASGFTTNLVLNADLANGVRVDGEARLEADGSTFTLGGAGNGLSGAGTIRIQGDTLILAGSNSTNTGSMIIEGGTLIAQATAGGVGGAIGDTAAVAVESGGAFQVDAAETIGALTVDGIANLNAQTTIGGDLAVNGASAGNGININAPTQIGGSFLVNAGAANLNFATTVGNDFAVGGGTVAIDGTMVIGGSFILDGGTVTVRAAPTIGGDLIVNGGFLNLNAIGISVGSLSGAGGEIDIADFLEVGSDNTSTTYSGILGGDGLRKVGTGTLTLDGSGGLDEGIEVAAGAVVVNGDYTFTSADVDVGAVLGGTGILSNIELAGTIAPGATGASGVVGEGIGTLTANVIFFQPGSIYRVTVDGAGNSDLLHLVSGPFPAASVLDGTVAVQAQGTFTPGVFRYEILRADAGYTGTFKNVTSNFEFLTPTLDHSDPNSVFLELVRAAAPPPPGPGPGPGPAPVPAPLPFDSVADTPNQAGPAKGVDQLGPGNPVHDAVLFLPVGAAPAAFDQLSGEVNASASSVALEDNDLVRRAVLERLRSLPQGYGARAAGIAGVAGQSYAADLPSRRAAPVAPVLAAPAYSVWGQAFGARGHLDGNGNAASLDRTTGGLVLGVDTGFEGRWRAGFAGAYTHAAFDVASRLSSGELDSYHLVGYGAVQLGAVALRGGVAYAHHEVDTSRTIVFPGYAGAVGASFGGASLQGFAEAGYGVQLGATVVEPFAGLAHVSTDLGRFAEAGDAAALAGDLRRQDVTYSSLGLRVTVPVGGLTARAGVSWRHAFGEVTPAGLFAFASNPLVPFTIAGVPIARDVVGLEAGLEWAVARSVTMGVKYDGQLADRAQEHAVKADLRVSF